MDISFSFIADASSTTRYELGDIAKQILILFSLSMKFNIYVNLSSEIMLFSFPSMFNGNLYNNQEVSDAVFHKINTKKPDICSYITMHQNREY